MQQNIDANRWPPLSRVAAIVAGALMALGALIRIRAYVTGFPLFADEALLAQNLLTHSWSQLWQPLDYAQTAPPLFLVVAKALASTLGYGEHALRAVPFLAGCLVPPLAWFVSRQLLENEESMLVVALLALSPTVIFYNNSFKQYSSDVLVSLVIIGITLPALRARTPRRLLLVGIVGAACQLFSSTSVFVLAGAGTALALNAVRGRRPQAVLAVTAIGALWLGIGVTLMGTTYRRLYDLGSPISRYMRGYWGRDFLTLSLHSVGRAMSHMLDGVFLAVQGDESFGVRTIILATLLLLGFLRIARAKDREVTALLTVPLLLLVLASIDGRYPLGTRLVLFTAPVTALYVAAGAGAVVRRLPSVAGVGLIAASLVAPVLMGLFLLRHPLDAAPNTDTELIELAASMSRTDSDAVYFRGRELADFVYYARPDTAIGRRLLHLIDQENPATLFSDLRGEEDALPQVADSALTVRIDRRPILVGRPRLKMDTMWGANEARRIKAAAPCTEVFVGRSEQDANELRSAVRASGGVITNVRHTGTRTSFHACFALVSF